MDNIQKAISLCKEVFKLLTQTENIIVNNVSYLQIGDIADLMHQLTLIDHKSYDVMFLTSNLLEQIEDKKMSKLAGRPT